MRASAFLLSLFIGTLSACASAQTANGVYENLPQEQVFGAEIQYFRLRGGYEANVPRAEVISRWSKALDAAKNAKMNMVSFYIPWDFHEYAPGKFDFDGTVDADGDGHPDYPSRDIKTFIKMIQDRGFKYVMVRPGPYINAEWGPLGFGAIPMWFHDLHPEAHMQGPQGHRTRLYDYHNPDFLKYTQLWFKAVHDQVLAPYLGNLIRFVQVDNETNFLWQSIYNHDYSPTAQTRYREYLMRTYGNLAGVNAAHHRQWQNWDQVRAPAVAGQNVNEDQDWYRFQDLSIHSYLKKIRAMWTDLGVLEPQVIFTLAESYNATHNGLLPNPWLRNDPEIGMATVNLYPKTWETALHPFLNQPFKSDHDVVAQEAASERYLGDSHHWVMGPEIQAGWWKGTPVSWQARQQTYLSVVGHGMKGMLVYYFNEGQNWGVEWAQNKIQPYFDKLKSLPPYRGANLKSLPDEFWQQLQKTFDDQEIAGFDVRHEIMRDLPTSRELFFDSPLTGDAEPRPSYDHLKQVGEQLAEHADWLGKAVSVYDPVCFVKDVEDHVPTAIEGLDYVSMNAEWASALIGYALNSNANMRIHHWGINPAAELDNCRILFHQDAGHTSLALSQELLRRLHHGQIVVNLLGDSFADYVGVRMKSRNISKEKPVLMSFAGDTFQSPALFSYKVPAGKCTSILNGSSARTLASPTAQISYGYRCRMGAGEFYQIGAPFYAAINTDSYSTLTDMGARTWFLRHLLADHKIPTALSVVSEENKSASQIVAFAREVPGSPERWVTVKSGQNQPVQFHLQLAGLKADATYRVIDLFNQSEVMIDGKSLMQDGFPAQLDAIGSTVYWLTPEPEKSVSRR